MPYEKVATPEGTYNCLVEGEGQPLLLLHGLGTSLKLWENVIPALEPRFRIIAPDNLSHGESSRPHSLYTIQHHARSTFMLLAELDIYRFAIAGNSMGAQIAFEMASYQPDRVSSIVSFGCPAWGSEEARMNYLTMRSPMVGFDGMPRRPGQPDLSGGVPEGESEGAGRGAGASNLGIWYLNSLWAVATYDIVPKLPKVKCRCLSVYGTDDWLKPTEATLLEGLSKAESEAVTDGGHLVPQVKPTDAAHCINRFVR